MRIIALCGGVGGAKLADGLQQCLSPGELHVIVNTGDDFEHRGLPICPDLDTVLYTLGAVANAEQGWGRADESWQVQTQWRELGLDTWFQLGDRDIALHLYRRELLSRGLSLTQVMQELAQRLGVTAHLLPMCDAPAPTIVVTDEGEMPFQEYFVKHRCRPVVKGFHFGAAGGAGAMTAEVRAALESGDLDGIIVCPSNPYLSVAPILAVPGMRDRLVEARVPIIAVSPLIGGTAVKGPAAKIMQELDLPVTPVQIARDYADFLDVMLIDESDTGMLDEQRPEDPHLVTAPIMMRTPADRRALASACLKILRQPSV
jgi:LPPG:FO 2-phospho-L-lactate transferase